MPEPRHAFYAVLSGLEMQHKLSELQPHFKERGWPPVTRRHFDSLLSETWALIVGGPETVIQKVKYYDEVLGGVARLDFQMSVASLSREMLLSSTRLLGEQVRPSFVAESKA